MSCCCEYFSNCRGMSCACHVGYMLLIVGAYHVQCLVVEYMLVIVGACLVQFLAIVYMIVIVGMS